MFVTRARDSAAVLRHPKLLALAAGLISAAGFAPLGLWPVTLAAFALLIHLVSRATRLRGALALGYWFGVGHFTVGLNWIAHAFTFQDAMPHWFGYGAVVALSLYLAVYPALAAGAAWIASHSPNRSSRAQSRDRPESVRPSTALGMEGLGFVLLFAAAWIVTEWLRATMFTGFAWNPLGVVWMPLLPVAQTATWIGTYGLSGLAIVAAGALWLLVKRDWRQGGALLAVIAALSLPVLLPPATNALGPHVRVIQPNIGQLEKHDLGAQFAHMRTLARLSGPPSAAPRLLLWPEAAIDNGYLVEEEPGLRMWLARTLGPRDALLTGGVAIEYDKAGEAIGARNSSFALTPNARLVGRYDKAHLVPYGEYLPMRPILSAIGLSRLVPGDLDFWPGPGPRTIDVPGFGPVGVQICYEIIFSGHVIDPAHRPMFLFNPSNDAWFGAWGPPQHLAQARLRAIEEGMPVIRATPTGISAVIDAQGRLLASLAHETAGVIDMRAPLPTAPTLFAHFGNLLSFLFAGLLAALAVVIGRRAR